MKEKVVELLIYIMSEMQADKQLAEIDMNDLRQRGYTPTEISQAISWLHDNMQNVMEASQLALRRGHGSRRVLHEAEKVVIPTEGQGYLIQLVELGLLDDRDLETVIERAMLAGFERLSMADLRDIVGGVLASRERGPHRFFMNNEDTIH
jgi:uncharacterized protein Smg (DUF494 family)